MKAKKAVGVNVLSVDMEKANKLVVVM